MQVAVGLGIAGLDHRGNIDADCVGVPGELVHQPDVDVTVGRLGQFGHFCRFCAAQIPDTVVVRQVAALVELQHGSVELHPAPGGFFIQAAHELRVSPKVGEDPAGQHAFRAEHDVKVPADCQARSTCEHRCPSVPGCAHRKGGFIAHQAVGLQACGDRHGCGVYAAEIGYAVHVHEKRHHDHDHV